jgi:hypothetical protein
MFKILFSMIKKIGVKSSSLIKKKGASTFNFFIKFAVLTTFLNEKTSKELLTKLYLYESRVTDFDTLIRYFFLYYFSVYFPFRV